MAEFLISILCPLIGEAGTYVIFDHFSIICIILVTERSLLAPWKTWKESLPGSENASISVLRDPVHWRMPKEALTLKQREKVETSQADASSPSEKRNAQSGQRP